MRVLSLCDGCSMLAVSLEKANIPVEVYYSSEIDKNAIAVSKHNFPNHIRLGDVTKITNEQLDAIMPIDLVVFGSPCTSLSVANQNRSTGKDGVITGESAIFYDCHRILKYVNPKYYIMENVASAAKDCQKIITDLMGVNPIMLDAAWFSPQRRRRLFWTNIPGVIQPPKETWSKSVLKDILVSGTKTYNNFNDRVSTEKSATLGTGSGTITGKQAQMVLDDTSDQIPEKYYLSPQQLAKVRYKKKPQEKDVRLGYIEKDFNPDLSKYSPSQGTRILNTETKTTCLPSMPQGLDDKSTPSKHPCVTTALGRQGSSKEFIASCNSVEQNNDGKIRRLMPIECSRLMGLPDNYLDFGNYDGIIKELKDGSKYKLAGNGFHVDVVAYILNFIPK